MPVGPGAGLSKRGHAEVKTTEGSWFSHLSARKYQPCRHRALGSGKTEWVLNMALGFRACGDEVTVADVDIINPYFCVRQVADTLRKEGFRILTPPESTRWSDMPIITPEVSWALKAPGGRLLIDVGGDAAGGRALKQFSALMREAGFLLVLVVNPFRPSTRDTEGVLELVKGIEGVSELRVGALVANPHLMDQTTAEELLWGYRQVSDSGGPGARSPLRNGLLGWLHKQGSPKGLTLNLAHGQAHDASLGGRLHVDQGR